MPLLGNVFSTQTACRCSTDAHSWKLFFKVILKCSNGNFLTVFLKLIDIIHACHFLNPCTSSLNSPLSYNPSLPNAPPVFQLCLLVFNNFFCGVGLDSQILF